ncbi:FecR domain-containing protein [Pseudomonadota bacterium]
MRRKSPVDYLLPFLMILGLGIVIVLGLQLWSSWGKVGQGDIHFYIVEGSAKVLPDGQAEWDSAYSGTKLLMGDSLKTASSGRVVLEFFNGTIVRIGDDTAVTLADVDQRPDKETIVINLDNGKLWLNGEKSQGVKEAFYEVRTSNAVVKAKGTAFEVESDGYDEVVRVFDGDVEVDILISSNGSERVAETKTVGVGQELVLDEAILEAFADNKSPSVLQALSDEFKDSSWYRWNVKEDRDPSRFGRTMDSEKEDADAALDDEEDPDSEEDPDADAEDSEDEEDTEDPTALEAPLITDPEGSSFTISEGEAITISGTIVTGASEMKVETASGEETISSFEAGDRTFAYIVNEDDLEPGSNDFTFFAVDSDGTKGNTTTYTVKYDKEVVEILEPLESPKAITYNGSESSTVTDGEVIVKGSVAGAEKVVVNDYTLSAFEPGDSEWSYFAKESLGNLKPGGNEFEVYAIDEEGNKSSVTTFTITYDKKDVDVVPDYGF